MRHKSETAAVVAGMVAQFDHIWSTKKENRIRLFTVPWEEIEHQIELLLALVRELTRQASCSNGYRSNPPLSRIRSRITTPASFAAFVLCSTKESASSSSPVSAAS
jgi:hypothetical protein